MNASSTACIVLAGGLGTRLRSQLPRLPKCLAPVAGRPFLELQLESLARRGVRRFVLSLGYMAEQVTQAVEPLRRAYAIDCVVEREPLGTGGAVVHALEEGGMLEALVVNGDTFLGGDLSAMLGPLDVTGGELMRMAVVRVEDCERFGRVLVEDGRVIGFTEKGDPGPGLINAGLYRVSAGAFANAARRAPLSLEADVMPALVGLRAVSARHVAGEFSDIGVPDDYRRFCLAHA